MRTNVFQTYEDLKKQAELLQEVSMDFDPTVVDLVQVAIAEDVLFFDMVYNHGNRKELLDQYLTGEFDIKTSTIESARVLVNLILGEP